MAFPSYSTYPGYALYPGETDAVGQYGLATLPAPTVEDLLSGARRVSASVTADLAGRSVDVPIVSGSVSESWDATPRATASLSVPALDEWAPRARGHILDPRSGARFRIAISVGEQGEPEPAATFTYGTFVATSVSVTGEGIDVACADLSHVVRGRLLTAPMGVHPGLDPQEQAGRLLARRAPWVRIASGASGLPPTAQWLSGEAGADPWEEAGKLAKAAGATLYFDHDGLLRVERITDPLIAPVVATWRTDSRSVLDDMSREIDGDDMPDAVIVKWSGGVEIVPEDNGGRLVLWDGDAETIADAPAARAAGEADLALRRGAIESVSLKAWPRYGLHAGDVVRVEDETTSVAMTARVVKLDIPLDGGPMSVTLADRRLT